MKLSLRSPHPVIGALLWAFVMSLMTPQMAGARTMLQLEDGVVLSFADGDIDIRSGSGELYDVEISDNGEVTLIADYLYVDADGSIGEDDWYINDLLMENALVPEAGLFVNRVEVQELLVGALDDDTMVDAPAPVTEQSLFRMTNLSLEAEEALISIDEISSLPFRLGEPTPGNNVVTEGGLAVRGMTIMPLEQARGHNPLIDKFAERGLNAVSLDFILMTTTDMTGTGMSVGYEFVSDIHDLAAIEFAIRFAVDEDVYARLLPLLAAPEDNAMAMLGLSGAIAVESSRLVIDDLGFGDIAFAVAAEEAGVSEAEYRSMARMSAASGVGATFPENVARLLPPIEAMLKQGGRLTATSTPDMPVPLTSVIGFAMYPDLAISQLQIALTHQP